MKHLALGGDLQLKIAYLANIRSDTYNESFSEACKWLLKLDPDDINELYLEFKMDGEA